MGNVVEASLVGVKVVDFGICLLAGIGGRGLHLPSENPCVYSQQSSFHLPVCKRTHDAALEGSETPFRPMVD